MCLFFYNYSYEFKKPHHSRESTNQKTALKACAQKATEHIVDALDNIANLTQKVADGQKLTTEELLFVYQRDGGGFMYLKDAKLLALRRNSAVLQQLGDYFATIELWDGNLDLDDLKFLPNDFKFPKKIRGDLRLGSLTAFPLLGNLEFPAEVDGMVDLSELIILPSNTKLPEKIGESLRLDSLKVLPEAFSFPREVGGTIDLSSLESLPENVKFPEKMGGELALSNIKTFPSGIKFPREIGRELDLRSVEVLPEDCLFPEKVASLRLDSLQSLSPAVNLPREIEYNLNLGSLKALPEGVVLPNGLSGSLDLHSVELLPEGFIFPENIKQVRLHPALQSMRTPPVLEDEDDEDEDE